jgi:hypothetical protein
MFRSCFECAQKRPSPSEPGLKPANPDTAKNQSSLGLSQQRISTIQVSSLSVGFSKGDNLMLRYLLSGRFSDTLIFILFPCPLFH